MFEPRFRLVHDPADAVADVIWLTHAGGVTNTLVHRARSLPSATAARIQSPLLPQREELSGVNFDGDLVELASLLARQIAKDCETRSRPLAIIGHSFGSVLAYRVTCELRALDIQPHRLVALSFPAPDRATHERQLHKLSDVELVHEVDALFGGIPENVRTDPAAQALFVPALRFDLGLLERYDHSMDSPVAAPVVAICGTDDPAVSLPDMQRWNAFTSGVFRLRSLPGDHFFPLNRMPEILDIALWDVLGR